MTTNKEEDVNETTALLSSSSSPPSPPSHKQVLSDSQKDTTSTTANNNKSTTRCRCRTTTTLRRFFMLLVLAGIVGGGVVVAWLEFIHLQSELEQERQSIDELTQVVHDHERVIARFNSSITHGDVLQRLQDLQDDYRQTKRDIQHELDEVQRNVSLELETTSFRLNASVVQAQSQIHDQVTKFKSEFDHYAATTQAQFSMENSFMVWQLAGTFTVLACLVSMWHMTAHFRFQRYPTVQRKILAILWMSPIYAVTSWFSLVFPMAEGYLAICKDGYEAYIIYQFLAFCIAVLGDRKSVVELLARRGVDHLTPPFSLPKLCCNKNKKKKNPYEEDNVALADAILLQCQTFALQFVLFRPLTTTFAVLWKQFGPESSSSNHHDQIVDWTSPLLYNSIIQNISIFVAFTGLLKFYHAVEEDLAWLNPFRKFLCIKGVVFLTFWQGLAISMLAEVFTTGDYNREEWATSAQNFLICLEMLLFSIAHFFCFPTDEWQEGYRDRVVKASKFGDSMALGDFLKDVKLVMRRPRRKKKKQQQPEAIPEESDIMPDDEEESETEVVDDDDDLVEAYLGSGGATIGSADSFDEVRETSVSDALKAAIITNQSDSDDDDDELRAAKKRVASKILGPDSLSNLFPEEEGGGGGALSGGGEEDDTQRQRRPRVNGEPQGTLSARGEHDDDDDGFGTSIMGGGGPTPLPSSSSSSVQTTGHVNDDTHGGRGADQQSATHDNDDDNQILLRPSIFTTVASLANVGGGISPTKDAKNPFS